MEEEEYRINDTVDYICGNSYTCIASQFPDSLLRLAPEISSRIQQYCREKGHDVTMYLLADTTYNSLSVDEVASSHIQADCVIHYGRASLTPVSRVPAFYVFPRQNDYRIEDVEMMQRIRDALEETGRSRVMCCIDQVYSHCMGTVQEEVSRCLRSDTTATIVFPTLRSEGEACCRREATVAGYHMPEEEVSDDTVLVWFGAPDASSKRHLMMPYNAIPCPRASTLPPPCAQKCVMTTCHPPSKGWLPVSPTGVLMSAGDGS
jgi:diphthamide biosynthesis enzyme Dph1/Dph2-like protein